MSASEGCATSSSATSLNPPSSTVLERWGRASWLAMGIVALSAVVYGAVVAVSGIVVPLLIAVVIGMLSTPVVDWLAGRRIPRPAAAGITIIGLLAIMIGSVALAVNGVIDQSDEITRQLTAGINQVDLWFQDLDVDLGSAGNGLDQAKRLGADLLPGVAGWLTTAFSGLISFVIGSFVSLFLLYFILADWEQLRHWLGRHLGVPADLGESIIDDTTSVIRQGFSALTVSSIVTAVLIGATMLILGVPLAFTVALVTFVTSYIPYLGAILSATFACLVALGASGTTEALVLLVVILVVQNVVQTVVSTKLTSDRLALHPIAGFASTVLGASLAGLLGATLSAPVLASIILVRQRIEEYRPEDDGEVSRPAD